MAKSNKRLVIEQPGIPPVKQPGPNEGKKNKDRKVRLQQKALNITRETQWPVEYYTKNIKMSITYYRGVAKLDSANIIGGIADSLQGPCYHNDKQLVEIHYSEQKKSRKKYKRDRYEVALEAII